jgi:anaerobic ribonucleoside-triphosphate reductase activating protein
MDELLKETTDQTYLDGITFSGGDPFEQAEKFAYMAKQLKQQG